MVEIEKLTKNYGLTPVLQGVDLTVAAGEAVTIIGANGAGKSTLLRIVATLARPTAGTVEVGGWPLPRYAARVRRHIGLVSHHSLLYPDLTAEENLRFFARLYGLGQIDIGRALSRAGLAARARDPLRTFSRGMVQRLAIARATLHEPDILLLDEPHTGLDEQASQTLDQLLQQERARGRAILLITHDLLRGLRLADRTVVLQKGKIVREVLSGSTAADDLMRLYAEVTGG